MSATHQPKAIARLSKPLGFFELLDDAFEHAQGVFPHDVLELQRQRLRSGTWVVRRNQGRWRSSVLYFEIAPTIAEPRESMQFNSAFIGLSTKVDKPEFGSAIVSKWPDPSRDVR